MPAKLFASFGLLVCLALALHMCLRARRRQQLEAWLSRGVERLNGMLSRRFNGRERRLAAHQEAMNAISRAQRSSHLEPAPLDGSWEGNIYRPKRFEQKPQKPH